MERLRGAVCQRLAVTTLLVLAMVPCAVIAVSQNNLHSCIANLTDEIVASYADEKVLDKPGAVTADIEVFVSNCLGLSLDQRAVRIMVPYIYTYSYWLQRAAEYQGLTGYQIVLTPVSYVEDGYEIIFELTNVDSGMHDGWIMDPYVTGQVAQLGGFAILDELVADTPALQWSDFNRFFREVAALYAGQVIGIPLDGNLFLMYYRKDLFQAYNLSVPNTWDEMIQIAAAMNGTKTQFGELYGTCFDVLPACKGGFILANVLATYTQYQGTSQGAFFDPDTMEALLDNPAMGEALRIMHQLYMYAPSASALTCNAFNEYFQAGNCLMTINWGDEFKATPANNISAPGMLGVAQVPGSTHVLDRQTMQLVACTKNLCPYASVYQFPNGTQAWLNRSPYAAFGSWTGAVSSRTTTEYQKAAFGFFAYLASPNNSWVEVSDMHAGAKPYRDSQLSTTPSSIAKWAAAGYDPASTVNYLSMVKSALDDPNMVVDLRGGQVVGTLSNANFRLSIEAAFDNSTIYNRTDYKTMMTTMQQNLAGVIPEAALQAAKRSYWGTIGRPWPTSPPPIYAFPAAPPLGTQGTDSKLTTGELAGVIAAPAVAALLILAGVLLIVHNRASDKHRTIFGKLVPPAASANTTLVITDIQNSTSLWENLPEHIMDQSLKLHNTVLRAVLNKHSGYESATEGDSFLIAFHTPINAFDFALEVQQELLQVEWPSVLLMSHFSKLCHVQQVTPVEQQARCLQLLRLNPNKRPLSSSGAARGKRPELTSRMCFSSCAAWLCRLPTVPFGRQQPLNTAMSFNPVRVSHHEYVFGSWGPEDIENSMDATNNLVRTATDATSTTIPLSPHTTHDMHGSGSNPADCMGTYITLDGNSALYGGTNEEEDLSTAIGRPLSKMVNVPLAAPVKTKKSQVLSSTLLQMLQACWVVDDEFLTAPAAAGAPARLLMWRGLRVRIALHTGMSRPSDIVYNSNTSRMQYLGDLLSQARLVAAAAAGGAVYLSEQCLHQLPWDKFQSRAVVLHMGKHIIEEGSPPTDLYMGLPAPLACRLVSLPPPQTFQQLTSGTLMAPLGMVAVAFLKVVGAAELMCWSSDVAKEALQLLLTTAQQGLFRNNGYLVEAADGLILASFQTGAAAIEWAMTLVADMLTADWSGKLLQHALCEEYSIATKINGRMAPKLLLRGLRIKAGIDFGALSGEIHAVTGRMSYRGKAMNRASRVADKASSGEVLCTGDTWVHVEAQPHHNGRPLQETISAVPLGAAQLKGVSEKLDIYQCIWSGSGWPWIQDGSITAGRGLSSKSQAMLAAGATTATGTGAAAGATAVAAQAAGSGQLPLPLLQQGGTHPESCSDVSRASSSAHGSLLDAAVSAACVCRELGQHHRLTPSLTTLQPIMDRISFLRRPPKRSTTMPVLAPSENSVTQLLNKPQAGMKPHRPLSFAGGQMSRLKSGTSSNLDTLNEAQLQLQFNENV